MSGIAGSLAGLGAATASNIAYILPALITAIAYFQYDLMDPESRPIDMNTELLWDNYDFIVVGSGSAGTQFLIFTKKIKLMVHLNADHRARTNNCSLNCYLTTNTAKNVAVTRSVDLRLVLHMRVTI